MPSVYEHRHIVAPEEIDEFEHVNNVHYLRWMQHVAMGHSAAHGWPSERYQKERMAWVARRHTIEYLKPAFAGDEILIRTWIADFKRITSTRKYQMFRGADLIATAETNWAFINLTTGLPARIPADLASSFAIVAEPPEA